MNDKNLYLKLVITLIATTFACVIISLFVLQISILYYRTKELYFLFGFCFISNLILILDLYFSWDKMKSILISGISITLMLVIPVLFFQILNYTSNSKLKNIDMNKPLYITYPKSNYSYIQSKYKSETTCALISQDEAKDDIHNYMCKTKVKSIKLNLISYLIKGFEWDYDITMNDNARLKIMEMRGTQLGDEQNVVYF